MSSLFDKWFSDLCSLAVVSVMFCAILGAPCVIDAVVAAAADIMLKQECLLK